MGHGNRQRPHRPDELGPRVFRRGRWWSVDLRPWGGGRPTLRNPADGGWPKRGERTEDQEVAERWRWDYLALIRGEKRRRQLGLPPPPRLLEDVVSRYLDHRRNTVEPATLNADRAALKHLRIWFPDATTADVTTARLQELFDFRRGQGYAATTLRTMRISLSAFFGWLGGPNPAAGIALPKVGKRDVRAFSDAECGALLDASVRVDEARARRPPSAEVAVSLALDSGMRQSELYACRWGWLNAAQRTIRVTEQLVRGRRATKPTKGGLARTALVLPGWWERHQPDAVGLVLHTSDGSFVSEKSQRELINRILDAAGLNAPGVGYHAFRHTYARRFIELGGRLEELQRSLGHASIRTTEQNYQHFHEDVAARLARERIYGA